MTPSLTSAADVFEPVAADLFPPMSCRTKLQWGRKLLHVSAAVIGFLLYGVLGISRTAILTVLGAWVLIATTTEICRYRFPGFNTTLCRVFAPIMRERERRRISSASWYIASMWVVFLVCSRELSLIVLWLAGVGDTAAGVVGAKWGRLRLNTHVSVEGLLAAFVVSFVGAFGFAGFWLHEFQLAGVALVAFAALVALVGVLAESLFPQLDDNLVIPLLSAPTVWGLMQWFA